MLQAFLEDMETAMAKHPLFAGHAPNELDAATEALEKYLMTKLHDRTFGVVRHPTEGVQARGLSSGHPMGRSGAGHASLAA